jgi:hypothetical protein
VRLPLCLVLVALGVAFAFTFRLTPHLMLVTGDNSQAVGPITSRAAYVQELDITGPARIASLEVILATFGKPTNTTHDEIRVFDGNGRRIDAVELPPGTVTDNEYLQVVLPHQLSIAGRGRFFVAFSSTDGTPADSITAWATPGSTAGRVYSVPAASLGPESLPAAVAAARPLKGAIWVHVSGQGPHRLLAEKALRVGALLALVLLAACAWWVRPVCRWVLAGRSAFTKRWDGTEERFARSPLSRLGHALSEEHLIRFDFRTQIFCVVGLLVFVGLVAFEINGSSVEMFNQYVRSDQPGVTDNSVIAGRPKAIRSDEWLVTTPALLHEYMDPSGQTSSEKLVDVASPWNWGFHVLGVDRGFSFMWDFWVFGSVFAFFFLVMLLTGNNFGVSIFSSLFLFLSSYNRWWDISIYVTTFSVLIVCLICFLQSRKRLNIWLSFVLLCVFGLKFVLQLYPPWQVTLVYLLLFIVVGFLLKKGSRENLRAHLRTKVGLAMVGVVGAAGVGALGYILSRGAIQAESNTLYPGKRVLAGGDVGFYEFFSGYLDPFFNEARFFLDNICESASFVLLFPFVIVAILLEKWFSKDRLVKSVTLALVAYVVLWSIYMVVGYGPLLSRVLLLDYVPGHRAWIGLGLAGILLVAMYVSEPPSGMVPHWVKGALAAAAFCGMGAFSVAFHAHYGFPSWAAALALCAALAVAVGAVMTSRLRPVFFIVMLLFVAAPSLDSNPIARGLAPIYGKRLVQTVTRITAAHPGQRWLVYGGVVAPEIVRAGGADVLDGVQWPPDLAALHELDPTGAYAQVWDRYAHVQAVPGKLGSPTFTLDQTDVYTMAVSPLEPALTAAHVGLFVAPSSMKGLFPQSAFRQLTLKPLNGYLIFEKKISMTSSRQATRAAGTERRGLDVDATNCRTPGRLALKVEFIYDGDKPFIAVSQSIRLDDGSLVEGLGSFGQSACVLRKDDAAQ